MIFFRDISRNHLTVIEGLLFKDLGNLKTMILRHNNIIDLQDGSFYGLSNLKQLYVLVINTKFIYLTNI